MVLAAVQLHALLFIVNALLRDACARLAVQGLAACQLSLHFTLESGLQSLSLQLGEPTRDPIRILRLIRHRLERNDRAAPPKGCQSGGFVKENHTFL